MNKIPIGLICFAFFLATLVYGGYGKPRPILWATTGELR